MKSVIQRDQNSCLFGEELVSYIYGELPEKKCGEFEVHLLSCTECTEEFALISESRLGVYEWYRDEFVPLETPAFVIPVREPVAISVQKTSWLSAIQGLFSPARLATAGAAFAVLAFAFGAIYVSTNRNEPVVAGAMDNMPPVTAREKVEQTTGKVDETIALSSVEVAPVKIESEKESDVRTIGRQIRPERAKAQSKTKTPVRTIQAATTPQTPLPRLGNYDEVVDSSLRLADLVADIDS